LIIVWGRRVHAQYHGLREARCGRCLTRTKQAVSSLEARSHVYFIEFGATDLGRIAQCQDCDNTVPILARTEGGPKRSRRERWMDTFLDAHLLEITRADRGTSVGVLLVVMAIAAMVVFGWVASMLGSLSERTGLAILGVLAVVLVVLVRLAFVRSQRVIGDAMFARSVRARLAKLRVLVDATPRDLANRASALGYARLAQHFDLPRYAEPPPPGQGPYRSAPSATEGD
jgi:hypothetical protein